MTQPERRRPWEVAQTREVPEWEREALERLGPLIQRVPVCVRCGHRHTSAERCAGHMWRDECPYNAGPDCPGTHPGSTG